MRQAAKKLRAKLKISARGVKQRYVIDEFNYIYYHGTDGVQPFSTMSWFGVDTLKCPTDMWVYQELLYRTKPDVIVECGVRFGGSGLYLAHLCDMLGKGRVVGCDITLSAVHEKTREHPRIQLIEGSSTDPAIVEQIARECAGQRTMVILDSDHSEKHVSGELKAYSPLVSPGCYLIVEDTNVNGHPAFPAHGPGPYEAVQKFLAGTSAWRVDKSCERFLVTFNPSGYLLRL